GEQGSAGERQIADRVEDLVADELVREARALRVEDAGVGDDEGVFERRTERVAPIPQRSDGADEGEGARARNLAPERIRSYVKGERLASDQRMVEFDLGLDAKAARVRSDLAESIAHGDPDRLENPDVAPGLRQRLDPDLIDR